MTIRHLYSNRPNCYEIYINNKSIGCIKDKKDFFNIEDIIKKDAEKRFGKVNFKDSVKLIKRHTDSDKCLKSSKDVNRLIIENSNTEVNAVLMKSDGREVGVLANEKEMRQVLDKVKNSYKEKEKSDQLKLVNYITYVNEDIKIRKVNSVEEVISTIGINSKNPIIAFSRYTEDDLLSNNDSLRLSRGSFSRTAFMSIPSQGTITSPFGSRWGTVHQGIDIGASMGAPIYAAMDGKVYCTEWENGYGNVIKIDHGQGIQTVYAHCSNICSTAGEYVNRGEKIGEVGSTGRSTGPHVHFEVRINGKPENPLKYLK
ncbi:M23 family metallopeptidase [Clostridium sp. P21]|uniref:M23 family metallopeptidase n=1 Tax=Clostridium muellerianum TaxID=2716538 RepID=A0A7Y0EEM9_9CLOT|nr:M23 family metallopeptidase [Clostridium muellerianum]